MGAIIATDTFNSSTYKGALITSGGIARSFSFTGGWTTLRAGFRLWIRDPGAAPASGSIFACGLQSGVTNNFGSGNCDHFVGLKTTGAADAGIAWSRVLTANSNINIVSGSGTGRWWTKVVDNVVTKFSTSSGTNIAFWGPDGSSAWRSTNFILEYTKVSGTQMTLTAYVPNLTVGAELTYANLLTQMEAVTPSGTYFQSPIANATGPLASQAVNEGVDGTLDTVVMYWDKSSNIFIDNDVVLARIA